ncbi:MAG: arylsulfatase [Terriglobia bacterium]
MTRLSRRDIFKIAVAGGVVPASRAVAAQSRPAAGPSRKDRPNILFIMADQHRADCVGASGNAAIRTPTLDWIAREGARFSNAYSSTPSCIPARAALLTGLTPWHHGWLGMGEWPSAAKYPFEMPRAFREAGYYTASIGKNHFYPSARDRFYLPLVSHGYDFMLQDEHHDYPLLYRTDYHSWFWSNAPEIYAGDGYLNDVPDGCGFGWKNFWNAWQASPYPYPERLHRARWVGETAVRFLRNYNRPQPLFLKVSFIPPHPPYVPPARLMQPYLESALPQAIHDGWDDRYRPTSGHGLEMCWHEGLSADQVHGSRAGYYGQVTFVDEQVGHLLEELDARGWLEETLIFYCSDHGDMLGDHGRWTKAQPYQSAVRIPMLMRWPRGLVSAARGQVLSQTAEERDVLPTFLGAASIPAPEHLDGRSLLALASGRADGWRLYIDLEHDISWCGPTVHWNALTDGHTKYIFHTWDGSEQLFDLDGDPHELHDLASDSGHESQLRLWRRRMVAHLAERGDAWVKNGKLVVGRPRIPISPNYPRAEAKQIVIMPRDSAPAGSTAELRE